MADLWLQNYVLSALLHITLTRPKCLRSVQYLYSALRFKVPNLQHLQNAQCLQLKVPNAYKVYNTYKMPNDYNLNANGYNMPNAYTMPNAYKVYNAYKVPNVYAYKLSAQCVCLQIILSAPNVYAYKVPNAYCNTTCQCL